MADLPIIYTVRLDMSQDVEEESNRWNNTNHISDLLGSGFLSAVRFRSIKGEPKYLHLYELPGLELLSTEAYANVRKNDTWGPKLSHGFSNHPASLYEQVLAVNATKSSDNDKTAASMHKLQSTSGAPASKDTRLIAQQR